MRLLFSQQSLLLKIYLFFVLLTTAVSTVNATELGRVDAVVQLDSAVQDLLKKTESLQLAQHKGWFALLHYKKETLSQQHISQADDESFFLDKEGKTDANAELIANIRAFLRGPESNHAQCRFPARWWWLKGQLALSNDSDVRCPQLEAYMLRMAHDKLYLVFPTMYLNNPGSTFGHTFLRFDEKDTPVLLSQTLNYAARVDNEDSLLSYVSKGVLGGYQGFFKARQYFETVQEYSDIENRDIWEYQLAFSPAEIEQLVRHVWEVKNIDFDYYFFRENCAYRLLALLDVMRPEIQLTADDAFPFYAIPVDTVRALDDKDLILSREFRASLVTKIDDDLFDKGNIKLALDIISEQTVSSPEGITKVFPETFTEAQRLKVLRKSYNILQFNGQPSSQKSQLVLQLINELSLGLSAPPEIDFVKKVSPEKGHDSVRVAAGYGEQNNRQYLDIKFRPAFHDILDSPLGYIDGAAINVFDARLKWFEDNSLRLESLSFINVTSLSPLSLWRNPVSWMFDFKFDRSQLSETNSAGSFVSRGGVGVSAKKTPFMPFALLMSEWNVSSSYTKGYSLLFGVQLGLNINYIANQLLLSYELDDAVSGFELDKNISQFQWQYNFKVNHAMRLVYKRIEYDFFDDEDWVLDYHYYF